MLLWETGSFIKKKKVLLLIAIFPVFLFSCATLSRHLSEEKLPAEEKPLAYTVADDGTLLSRYAPVFLIEKPGNSYNRIGTPRAGLGEDGKEIVFVDPARAAVYAETRRFQTSRGVYRNLVYRIHFEAVPAEGFPFHLGQGKNVGLIVVVTMNSRNEPLLYTLVHTCGCYLAFVPTSFLPVDQLPKGWQKESRKVYGERLTGRLEYNGMSAGNQKAMIFIRSASHRVTDIRLFNGDVSDTYNRVNALILPLDSLERLPLEGSGTTSFYEISGPRSGYVKGSHKPWERLFMSWWSFDLRIGEDKKLGSGRDDGILFYTSLKPWNRQNSDMRDFAAFLNFWNWGL